jgi:hypothetical protein
MPLKLTPDELAALESAMRHPRPWSISATDNFIRDANGEPVADIGGNSARADATGRFIVSVINATLDMLAKHQPAAVGNPSGPPGCAGGGESTLPNNQSAAGGGSGHAAAEAWWAALPTHLKRKYNREGTSVLELYREWLAR